ncbi:MAG: hypothetical protein A2X45_08840 [Lentisphaerae bacterium GWF2_50_93]|nr:MAG: hypothetical protein A2X45_08840 [Lentisphaerae bacterium GWF2_50_93]
MNHQPWEEMMKLYVKEKCSFTSYASEPSQVYDEFKSLSQADQETLWILGMNAKNKVMLKELISLGSLDVAVVYPRVIFKRLLMTDSSSLILVHNHPTGVPDPSNDDIRLTSVVKDGAKIFDIKVLDHIIIGDSSYFSFRERNLL